MLNSITGYNFKIFSNRNVQNNGAIKAGYKNVSFLGADKFTASPIKKESYLEQITDVQRQQIRNQVENIVAPDSLVKPIGYGADGAVYKVQDVAGFPEGLAVKVSHIDSKNPKTGEMQRTGCDFKDEIEVLKKVKSLDENSQHYVAVLNMKDGRNVLVTTFVKGKNPDLTTRPLNSANISSMLDAAFALDLDGVLHRDLKKENIIIDDNDNAGLIDFGAAISFDLFNFEVNTNQNNFPPFEAPSNLRSLEDTLIFPYLNDMKKQDPAAAKAFFTDYLRLKAGYHSKRAESLRLQAKRGDIDSESSKRVRKMADYEQTVSDALQNPDKNVVQAELLRGGITYNSELAYKNEILLLNPLANISLKWNSLIQAKKLEKFSSEMLMRPNTPEKRMYYAYMKEYAKYNQEKISGWVMGLSNWLLTCLKTDSNDTPDYMQDIISQCTEKTGIQDFEIPDVTKFE